jgi:hypothetical protein
MGHDMAEGKETSRVPEVEDGGERGELTAPEHEVSFFGGTKQERGNSQVSHHIIN